MALVKVKFTAQFEQTIRWPDDELGDFNYENLGANLIPDEDYLASNEFDIQSIEMNGEEYTF